MTHFVLIHGAWHGGWCWDRLATKLHEAGHGTTAPTLSGLAGEAHLDTVDLATHVEDITSAVLGQPSHDVVLVAHSYAGFPASVAAAELGARLAALVLVDAFVPAGGERLLDHAPHLVAPYASAWRAQPGWGIPPLPSAVFGVAVEDQHWVDARLRPQPPGTYFQRIEDDPLPAIRRKHYIRYSQADGQVLARSISRVRNAPDWTYVELDAPHDAMISHPQALSRALLDLPD